MKHLLYMIFTFALCFSGCNYLDVVPENDIQTIETIFEKRDEAAKWLRGCYVRLTAPVASVFDNPAYTGTDEVVTGDYTRQKLNLKNGLFIGDGLQMAQEPYGNVWNFTVFGNNGFYAAIRYCNTFLEKIGGVYNMQEEEKRLWAAEIKALKAHFYAELMRRYGPVVLVPRNIGVGSDISAMQQPRRPVDTCVNVIVALLDEAMVDLPPLQQKDQSRWAYHSLESVAALKAQVLLYAASPLFNGNSMYEGFTNKQGEQLISTVYDAGKWKRAAVAADEAIRICLQNGKHLITGTSDKETSLLRVVEDVERSVLAQNFVNDEAIFMLRYSNQNPQVDYWPRYTRPYLKDTDPDYGRGLLGCISPSIKMVEKYYTDHGLPIEADKTWDYSSRYQMGKETSSEYKHVVLLNTDVLGLHLRREPRFYAHVAADRCYFQLRRDKIRDEEDIVKAYQGERFGTQATMINNSGPQNLSGYWMKKGSYTNVDNKTYESVFAREEAAVVIRLAELYLAKAEAWNEYLGAPDKEHVYDPLNEVRKRAGIPDVESAWLNYSNTPDKVKTKEGMRGIIRQEWDIEFAFEGKRFWNLRRWLTAREELNGKLYGWNILGQNARQFYNNYEGPVVVWAKRQFVAPRDYLFPLRSEEVMISNCVQNPGW